MAFLVVGSLLLIFGFVLKGGVWTLKAAGRTHETVTCTCGDSMTRYDHISLTAGIADTTAASLAASCE
jgi:hypothetical protein